MDERDDVISLQDYLTVLRRRKWLIIAVTLLTVLAAVGVSLVQTPVYEAESEVVVEPVRRTSDATLEDLLSPQNNAVETERLVVTSRPVANRAAEELGESDVSELLEDVRVEAVRDTRVVRIIAADTDPVVAASRADAFAEAYLTHRRSQAVDDLLAASSTVDERAAALRSQIADIDAQLDGVGLGDDEQTELELERESLIAQLAQVSARAAELGEGAQGITGGGAVLTPAEVPDTPVSPQPLRNGALALVLGLMLGVGLAFLRDFLDDVIRDEADFKRATGGRPVLGRIPTWEDPEGGNRLATVVAPTSLASEAYRELSAGVRFLLLASGRTADFPPPPEETPLGRSVMVSSATAGDGKTSTAANLAVAAARVGLRTLLVDADLRRATVARRFGLGRTTGLSDLLLSGDPLADHVVDVGIDNLRLLPAGTLPPNPNELLASAAMRRLEQEILQRCDLVIYDSPAVLAVPDALELGQHVDVAIVVARAESTGRRQLAAAIERLEQVGTEVAGSVLNGIDSKNDGYYYSYYYRQSDDEAGEADSRPRRGLLGRTRRSDDASGHESDAWDEDAGRGTDQDRAPDAADHPLPATQRSAVNLVPPQSGTPSTTGPPAEAEGGRGMPGSKDATDRLRPASGGTYDEPLFDRRDG